MNIKLKIGYTRVVILINDVVIKVAFPFRPFVLFYLVYNEIMKGTLCSKLKKYEGDILNRIIRTVFTGGIDANRREIRISREHPEYPIAHVLQSHLGGFILVMTRGESIEEKDIKPWKLLCLLPKHIREADLFYPRNGCRIAGTYLFCDYGDPSAEEILPLLVALQYRPE